ncbi:Hypothetical protein Tpal_747 [Trichococcus palustris]|uniref:Metal-dependent hydrolase n=1 Tax=Trichococcus palustris TaxID=140314 RepID=A0A143YE95_9LACT|nr:metal-dependent hydrolase [Trichococcus palustris]CZQ86244.1 Hypothetical protein Tpal_747 [Trichococcus palustris]SFK58199.1 inner membrane protein [Trichococcus palustris]
MTGKTHVAVGVATTLLITKPSTLKELLLCLGVSVIGSVICDIDVTTSESHQTLNKILGIILVVAVLLAFAEYQWSVGILSAMLNNSTYFRLFLGAVIFLGICIFGKEQPHRSFLHSLLGVALLSMAVYILSPTLVLYFAVAMASHIMIDTLNQKKVKLFYPLPGGIRFGLCSADGIVNSVLFKVGSLAVFVEIILSLSRMSMTLFS